MYKVNHSGYRLVQIAEPLFIEKIRSFATLPSGWNHGEGIPPKKATIEKAIEIARYAANNLLTVDAVPGLSGEVQLAIYEQNSKTKAYAEITFESYKKFGITKYRKTNAKWNITCDVILPSIAELEKEIDKFREEIVECRSMSEYSLSGTIIRTLEDFQVKHLRTTGMESQLYRSYASPGQVLQSVSI